jgi:hypothetical protein
MEPNHCRPGLLSLLRCLLGVLGWVVSTSAASPVVISEFMADNSRTLQDESGQTPDWIELLNTSAAPVELGGYSLSDNPNKPRKWVLPAATLRPGERRVIFASGREARDPAKPWHAPFKLSGEGGFLALFQPDGSLATSFGDSYPPQVSDVSFGFAHGGTGTPWYLPKPTPGKENLPAGTSPGPIPRGATNRVATSTNLASPLPVFVRVEANGSPVKQVTLRHRTMFAAEASVVLNDAGRDGDERAGDGLWSGLIPVSQAKPGTMVRWRFEAMDDSGATSRWPIVASEREGEKYLGTVLGADGVRSALPVFHLFIRPSDIDAADADQGARAACFLDGEFYDNIAIKVRGNTTAGFPKKSHRLEFPAAHPLRHPSGGGRIRNTSLMAEWGDPSYLRQHLSFWLMARAGVPAPFHEPVRVQLNGEFYQLAMHSQVLGEELLERTGLDPDGALYKAVGTVTPELMSTGGFEKKTRKQEDERDYIEFTQALVRRRGGDTRSREVFDRCDLPGVINYLAVARLTQEDDDIWANLSLYRDSEGSGRWRPVAFDMNVSWGLSFGVGGVVADQDGLRSHPFWGASGIGSNQGHNELYDAIIRTPVTREMLVRRMRTLMDRDWQSPGTPRSERVLERHIDELRARMAPEAALDRKLWGESWNASRSEGPERALEFGIRDLERRFIEPRRVHFYVTHCATNAARKVGVGTGLSAGIPDAQPAGCVVQIVAIGLGTKRNQDWIRLTNTHPFAVDVSGWKLAGDVKFTLPAGMVIPALGQAIVASDARGFMERTESPRPGEQWLVVGGFKGSLAKANTVEVLDDRDRIVHRWKNPGR